MDTCGYGLSCPPPPPPPDGSHLLPFTGLDLTFFVILACALIVGGVVLRMSQR